MLNGTGLSASDTLCIANDAELYVKTIKGLMHKSIGDQHIQQRGHQLSRFDNEKNALVILNLI